MLLTEQLGVEGVWIGEILPTGRILPLMARGISIDEIKASMISLEDIFLSPYNLQIEIKEASDFKHLTFGFSSAAYIPLTKKGNSTELIALYSSDKDYFKENFSLLKALQKELSLRLEKIEVSKERTLCIEILRNLTDLVIVLDDRGKVVFANEQAEKVLQTCEDFLNILFKDIKLAFQVKAYQDFFKRKEILRPIIKLPVRDFLVGGQKMWFDFSCYAIVLADKKIRYVLIGKNVSKEVVYHEELEKMRYYDELTGVLNYDGFVKKFKEVLSILEEEGLLIIIDLYDFSYINTVYGYSIGDEILKEVASRLAYIKTLVGRIVADAFGIFIPGIRRKEDVFEVIEQLKQILQREIRTEKGDISLEFNAGIAFFPYDGKDFDTLWKNANMALFQAKEKGAGHIEFFNPEVAKKASEYLKIQNLIKRALENKLFVFHFQPYFRTVDLKLAGLEALVRIKDKDIGLVYPVKFIEYLENSPYLHEFELWAVEKILEKAKKLEIPISFNLSIKTFKNLEQFERLFEKLRKAYFTSGLTEKLTVEITERVLAENLESIKELVCKLKKLKVKIAIDDFGTGYSSLNYVKNLPVNVLKIDTTFIKDLLEDSKSVELVDIIIRLARSFDAKVVAEGVEKPEQLEILKKLGCDYIQGFLLAKPLPQEELEAKISNGVFLYGGKNIP